LIVGVNKKMGYYSELQIEMQEREQDYKLAKILGLTIDELDELIYDIHTDSSKDGLIYNYRVEFDIFNSNPDILKRIKGLSTDNNVYIQPYELDENYYYDEELEAIFENENHLKKFNTEMTSLLSLLSVPLDDKSLKQILNRQIYISAIGTMELFLSEVFIIKTFEDSRYLQNFINSHPFFKRTKFELREIFKEHDKINETAKKVILDTIFHNLPTVSNMYKDTFEVEFPSIKDMYKYVMLRHDLVHRNGKTKEGKNVPIEDTDILKLINDLNVFINEIAVLLEIN